MSNTDLHLDQDIRIDNQRHAGIVIRDGNILLMHRIYKGREYWVIPGGHIQKGEDPLLVAIREIEEETSVIVNNPKLVFEFKNHHKDNHDFYYICDYVSGEPELGGEEKLKNSPDNLFEPMWLPLEQVTDINLLPKFAKEWIVETLIEKR
jgi:8-oxo-dGTP diphosphatase